MDLRKTPACLLLLSILTGCTTVGSGYRTVVRAPCDIDLSKAECKDGDHLRADLCQYLTGRYSHLVAPMGTQKDSLVLRIDPEGRPVKPEKVRTGTRWLPTYQHFRQFLLFKYGNEEFRPVDLSFKAHERTITPAYFATDPRSTWATAVTSVFTSSTLPLEERGKLLDLMEARLRHVPDLAPVAVPHHNEICETGCQGQCMRKCSADCSDMSSPACLKCLRGCMAPGDVYYYYPRTSVDFSSSFLSTSPMDRLSYLAMVIRLRQRDVDNGVRFIDFRPKDAEITPFNRGDLTLGAKATLGTDLEKASGGDASVFDIGLERSESFVSKLADSIEKKSTGILEDGRTFFVDLRSIREIRIAGNYNFDLMLEVPSRLERGLAFVSVPVVEDKLVADIFLIGVVRHVHARGRIGTFNRVPESENDHVFEQVVLRVLPGQELWAAPNTPWVDKPPAEASQPPCKLQVLTNREDAAFTVKNESGVIVEGGFGKRTTVEIPACGKLKVTFLPIVARDKVLAVEGSEIQNIDFGQGRDQFVEGQYLPKKHS